MCGFVYKSNFFSPCDYTKFISACESLKKRGPDDFGYLFKKNHSFGHRRLEIYDIVNGKQPMSILNSHLVYNGELYNINELKKYLKNKNINLDFKSDTLVLLKLLINYNLEILNKLNGIFSFVYVENDNVLAVRDMFGVKPLYYSFIGKDIIVASEIKAILKYKEEAIVNKEGLCEVLGMGPMHSQGKTPFKGIYELKPGYYLTFNEKGEFITKKYYELPAYINKLSYSATVKKVNKLLNKAIKRQMISDVNISTFLSGGLDSSIISTVVSKYVNNLDTYNITYENNNLIKNDFETGNDLKYAKIVSNSINAKLNVCEIKNEDLIKNLKLAVDYKDAPGMTDIDSSMIFLAKEIAKKYKVALSGECADELFGGYSWYYKKQKEKNIFPWIRNISFRQNLLNDTLNIDLEKYVKDEYNKAILEVPININDSNLEKKHRTLTYLNIKYFMTNLLDRKDRMTMGESLEVRVPFCDKELVELLYNIPFKYKYRYKTEKKLLKDAFKKEVNEEVINRKKNPYPKCNNNKYNQAMEKIVLDLINDKNSIINKIFNKDKIIKLINEKDFDVPWYGQLMRKTAMLAYIYQIDYWFKKYNIKLEV